MTTPRSPTNCPEAPPVAEGKTRCSSVGECQEGNVGEARDSEFYGTSERWLGHPETLRAPSETTRASAERRAGAPDTAVKTNQTQVAG